MNCSDVCLHLSWRWFPGDDENALGFLQNLMLKLTVTTEMETEKTPEAGQSRRRECGLESGRRERGLAWFIIFCPRNGVDLFSIWRITTPVDNFRFPLDNQSFTKIFNYYLINSIISYLKQQILIKSDRYRLMVIQRTKHENNLPSFSKWINVLPNLNGIALAILSWLAFSDLKWGSITAHNSTLYIVMKIHEKKITTLSIGILCTASSWQKYQ